MNNFKIEYVIVVNPDYIIGPFNSRKEADNYINTDSEFKDFKNELVVTVLQTPVNR